MPNHVHGIIVINDRRRDVACNVSTQKRNDSVTNKIFILMFHQNQIPYQQLFDHINLQLQDGVIKIIGIISHGNHVFMTE
ncbi:MAG: hypothetical protein Q8P90_05500 [bacterium]|nr:hypothetical protein [bacterium]